MDISSNGMATQAAQQSTLLGAQVQLSASAKEQGKVVMDTLLSSINSVQPAASVEPNLGNKIDTRA